MAYVNTPLGGRNMVNEQERMNYRSGEAGADRAHQMALAQMQSQTTKDVQGTFDRRAGHELTRYGDFGQNADLQVQRDQMNPQYLAAQLAQRKYGDQRQDDAPMRDLRNQAIGGLDMSSLDPMAGLALAGGNLPQYFQHVGQREESARQQEAQKQSQMAGWYNALANSGNPELAAQGLAGLQQTAGIEANPEQIAMMANPNAATERFQASERGAQVGEQFQDRSFLGGLGDMMKGGASAAFGLSTMNPVATGYGAPKALGGLGEAVGSVTDAIGLTGPDADQARQVIAQIEAETGGDPRLIKQQLAAVIAELGDRINEEWADPIRRAAEAYGALGG